MKAGPTSDAVRRDDELSDLEAATLDLRYARDMQSAVTEVLELVNSSHSDPQPAFEAIVRNASKLCDGRFADIFLSDGKDIHLAAHNFDPSLPESELAAKAYPQPLSDRSLPGRVILSGEILQFSDVDDDPNATELTKRHASAMGYRSGIMVPMIRNDKVSGVIGVARAEPGLFPERQVQMLRTFAAQAAIALENARLLAEITRREEELRVTFEHMGDGVVMFDADLRIAAWNRNFQQLLDVSDSFLANRPGLDDYVRLLVSRGEFGDVDMDNAVERFRIRVQEPWSAERMRPDGRVIEVRNNPVPGGGTVLIYGDVTERQKAEAEIAAARDAAEAALDKLKAAQANLVQSEKMASLGQLTAGIAHEIKNPLNFVNNFATLSVELLDELKEAVGPALATLDKDRKAEVDETMELLISNLGKIAEHGKRADGIVKSMLSHSRAGSGDWAASDINALVEEALNLAYHGARAQDKEFNVTLERDFDKTGQPIDVVPQDIARVFLNLFGNGFYAANKRFTAAREADFKPIIKVTTRDLGDAVEVRVRDNGIGIPPDVRDKLFQPFFTTKPTGEGTGLGLSISYDIVTQQHGGTIGVESEVGQFTEFTVRLPRSRRARASERVQ